LAGHTTTELNYIRFLRGFVNVTLARRYDDLKGLHPDQIFDYRAAHILKISF